MKNTLEKTKNIMRINNIKANKRFGQNFLIDDNILENIVKSAEITNNDLVIEIGPGLGNLTEYLLEKAAYVILVEIDNNMINILNDRFKNNNNNYILLNDDILKVNVDEIIENIENKLNRKFEKIKVVANLPYYITTPIIFKLLQNENRINEITVMVQKEVAERIVAKNKTKDYGILTLMVNYLGTSDIKLIVPNNSFIPAPNVTSAVIKITKNKRFTVKDEELLFKLIHSSFAQRRKKIINSLESTKFLNMSKPELEELFNECNISLNARAEELELQDYIKIVDIIANK